MRTLEERIADLIDRMTLLSEAQSSSVVAFTSTHGKLESSEPKGAHPDRKGPPHPDHDPLIVWFVYELERRETDLERRVLVAKAEVLYERRVHRQPGRIAGAMFEGAPESTDERNARIISEYEGMDEFEAASYESERAGYASPASIRLTRLKHRRDPHDGFMVEKSDEDYAVQLHAEGMSYGQIAVKIGKPKSTVQGWVERKTRKAA